MSAWDAPILFISLFYPPLHLLARFLKLFINRRAGFIEVQVHVVLGVFLPYSLQNHQLPPFLFILGETQTACLQTLDVGGAVHFYGLCPENQGISCIGITMAFETEHHPAALKIHRCCVHVHVENPRFERGYVCNQFLNHSVGLGEHILFDL